MLRSLRSKILAYLILLHLVLGGLAVVVLIERPGLLLAFEALFLLSALVGYFLVRAFFVPLDLIRTGTDLMREREFTTRFREVGQTEMDDLVRVYNEMTDRLREERLLNEERNLFIDKAVRASPTGLVVLDHDGRIVDGNPSAEKTLQVRFENLRGKTPAGLGGAIGDALASLPVDESRVLSIHGRRVKFSRAEFYDRGSPRSFFLFEELTEELRSSEKAAYGKVIRMMSHEVHNSVGAVRSLLESFGSYAGQLDGNDRPDFEQALQVAISRLQHLSSFMNGLASVVRVPPPEPRPCDVLALLRDLELLLRPELERRRIRLGWETPEPLSDVKLDKNQMEEVLVNVLRNSMEAVEENGEITIATGRTDGLPWLAIRDSGPGIDADLRSALFTPFFTTKRDGRGVGLTLSREILTLHRFDFSLDNRTCGGAEFLIRFG
jgi:signal transduction histidine kinase